MSLKGADILRFIDTIHRERNIDKEVIFDSLENALFSAARKKFGNSDEIIIEIDRRTGDVTAFDGEHVIDPIELGRIAALTFKQVMIQKFREAERDNTFDDYIKKESTLVTGTIQRNERPNIIVNLGRCEGIVPWREQVPTETYNVGDRIKCLVLEVKKVRQQVRIVLSRKSPELLRHLFELEVPEIADHTIEIRELARDAGNRSKVAVLSLDSNVDCVGACVGIRGSRIKNIVDELNGEKIDIVRWSDQADIFIRNAMKPAEINAIKLDYENRKAKLFVNEDMLSLAIGRRGQNVRLASALTGWDIDLVTGTPDAYEERFQVVGKDRRAALSSSSGESKLDKLLPGQVGIEDGASRLAGVAGNKLDAILSAPRQDSSQNSSQHSSPDPDSEAPLASSESESDRQREDLAADGE